MLDIVCKEQMLTKKAAITMVADLTENFEVLKAEEFTALIKKVKQAARGEQPE